MSEHSWIAILDFGSQYSQLIARRIREQRIYSEIIRFDTTAEELRARKPAGIIFSGGPSSVLQDGSPICDPEIYQLGIPILGICYGMQMTAHLLGGKVKPGQVGGEYGSAQIDVCDSSSLFSGLGKSLNVKSLNVKSLNVWMSHGDQVTELPPGFTTMAVTESCPIAAIANPDRQIYGLQFHPEVVHTPQGVDILRHFAFDICGCTGDWEMGVN